MKPNFKLHPEIQERRLGNYLRAKRNKKGLLMRDVAIYTGIDHSVISRIENGENAISFKNAISLSSLYGCSLDHMAQASFGYLNAEDAKMKPEEITWVDNKSWWRRFLAGIYP